MTCNCPTGERKPRYATLEPMIEETDEHDFCWDGTTTQYDPNCSCCQMTDQLERELHRTP